MNELKTLKDIEFEGLWGKNFPRMHAWKTRKILKAEAIKWVKEFDDKNTKEAFKHFFNLTEEDLKDGK